MTKAEEKAYKLLKRGLAQTTSLLNGKNCYYEQNDGLSFMNILLFNVNGEWVVADQNKKQLYRGESIHDAITMFIHSVGAIDESIVKLSSPLTTTLENIALFKKEEVYKSTTTYVDWLEKYTKKNPTFTCDSWVTDENQSMVKDAKCLYDIVKEYAKKNGIVPVACLEHNYLDTPDKYYLMSYNGNVYRVGSDSNDICPWVSTFLSTNENMENVISFDDIMSDKRRESKNPIDDRLDEFDLYLSELSTKVPKRLIKRRFEKFFEEDK